MLLNVFSVLCLVMIFTGLLLVIVRCIIGGLNLMKKQPQILQIKDKEYYQRINPETGEIIGDVIIADVAVKEVPRVGFAITYLSTIVQLIDNVGNKKMQVVKYVLQKMDSNNILLETVREISKNSGVSLQTVNATLQILESAGIIARKAGVIMLSPKLAHKGNAQRERYLMTRFSQIKESDE